VWVGVGTFGGDVVVVGDVGAESTDRSSETIASPQAEATRATTSRMTAGTFTIPSPDHL